MRESIAGQVRDLFYLTIVPAFGEDFQFESKEEYEEALVLLETLVREEMKKYVIVTTTDELREVEERLLGLPTIVDDVVELDDHVKEEIEKSFLVPREFL